MLRPSAVIELVWQDETGSTAVTTLSMPSSSTVTELDAAATALASLLVSLTDAVLIKQRLKYLSARETPDSASGGASIRRTGVFFFNTGDDTPIALIPIHAIKSSVVVSAGVGAGVAIDTTNSDVIAFINAVVDNGLTNPFDDDIIGFDAAYMQSRV